eukprot:3999749-Pleurochrysis_carterae.AAC.1
MLRVLKVGNVALRLSAKPPSGRCAPQEDGGVGGIGGGSRHVLSATPAHWAGATPRRAQASLKVPKGESFWEPLVETSGLLSGAVEVARGGGRPPCT